MFKHLFTRKKMDKQEKENKYLLQPDIRENSQDKDNKEFYRERNSFYTAIEKESGNNYDLPFTD